jgi:hypothetical protein
MVGFSPLKRPKMFKKGSNEFMCEEYQLSWLGSFRLSFEVYFEKKLLYKPIIESENWSEKNQEDFLMPLETSIKDVIRLG